MGPRLPASDAASGVAWASLHGFGASLLGGQVDRLSGPASVASSAVAAACFVGGPPLVGRHEVRLQVEADRMLPEARAA